MEKKPSIIILLVEDNDADAQLTLDILRENPIFGTEFHHVKTGVDAMKFLLQEGTFTNVPRPDIIILDLNMPGTKNGLKVIEEIRENEHLRYIPIIVLTSSESEEDILRSYQLQCNAYIVKPIDLDRFVKVLQGLEYFWFNIARLPTVSPSINGSTKKIINVLLVEDNDADAQTIQTGLQEAKREIFLSERVKTLQEGVDIYMIDKSSFDIIILDLGLSDSRGLDTVKKWFFRCGMRTPVVIVSGLDDREIMVESVHLGVQDYIMKEELISGILCRSIRYAIERHKTSAEYMKRSQLELELARQKLIEVSDSLHNLFVASQQ